MKALIIDDDAVCRKLILGALRGRGHLDEAPDGRTAMERFRDALIANAPYDLVTIDIMMPDMDGHCVLAALQGMEAVKGIVPGRGAKVFMTSALSDGKNILGAFRGQATAYLTKPIDMQKLWALCREHGLEG